MVFSQLEFQLKEAVEWSLANYLLSNAIFLCERLLAEPSSCATDQELKLNTLARCFLAENSPNKIVLLLRSSSSPENIYLAALALFQTGKYEDAERELLKLENSLGAEGFFLFGQICEKQSRFDDAIANYLLSLKKNPHLWAAYEKVCKLGHWIEPVSVFKSELAKHSLSDLLVSLGEAYCALTHFRIDEAIELLSALPPSQRDSSWGLSQLGRCFFEKYEFPASTEYFSKSFTLSPYRTEDLDIYSTAL